MIIGDLIKFAKGATIIGTNDHLIGVLIGIDTNGFYEVLWNDGTIKRTPGHLLGGIW